MCREKVKIPKEKPYIILRGKSRDTTVIEYGDYGNSMESSTFKLFAENFMARGITFTVRQLKNFHLGLSQISNKGELKICCSLIL